MLKTSVFSSVPKLTDAPGDEAYNWRRIFEIALRHRREIILAHIIAVVATFISVPIPLLMPLLVDEVLLEQPATLVNFVNWFFPVSWHGPILVIVAITLVTILLRFIALGLGVWQMRQFTIIAKDVVYRIRKNLIGRLQRVSMAEYETLGSGQVISHFVTDLDTLDQFIGVSISRFLIAVLTIVGTAVILLWMHWQLALFIFLVNPLVVYITISLGRKVKELKKTENEAYATFQQTLSETLEGIQQIRACNREQYYLGKVVESANAIKNHAIAYAWKTDAAGRLSFNVFVLGFDIFRALSMFMVVFSDLSIGEMMAVFAYLWFMLMPMQEIIGIQYGYHSAKAALQRVNKLFALSWEPNYPHKSNPFKNQSTTAIRLEKVCFLYNRPSEKEVETSTEQAARGETVSSAEAALKTSSTEAPKREMVSSIEAAPEGETKLGFLSEEQNQPEWVLDQISLDIQAGEKVAFVGASGGGKTTLVQVLLGLYAPQSGNVYFDNVPVTEIGMDVVREHVVTVLQHPALFNDTLRMNLTLGRELSDEQLWQALEIAQLSDVVKTMENGLDTLLGQRGVRLSGGQRQRVAVARMILANPKVVILDEATSALDTETESKLHAALNEFLKDKTTIIIAHRLSAVKQADRVFVFEEGRIIEEGHHDSLIRENGLYAKLYGRQGH
jgi:ATP-binding cassette subfamily C protein